MNTFKSIMSMITVVLLGVILVIIFLMAVPADPPPLIYEQF